MLTLNRGKNATYFAGYMTTLSFLRTLIKHYYLYSNDCLKHRLWKVLMHLLQSYWSWFAKNSFFGPVSYLSPNLWLLELWNLLWKRVDMLSCTPGCFNAYLKLIYIVIGPDYSKDSLLWICIASTFKCFKLCRRVRFMGAVTKWPYT